MLQQWRGNYVGKARKYTYKRGSKNEQTNEQGQEQKQEKETSS